MGGSQLLVDEANRLGPAAPDEEYVHGACAPGWHSTADHGTALDEWIADVGSHGIERVCCLLTGRQLDSESANVGRYREAFGPERVCHAPVPDYRLADSSTLEDQILPFLSDAVARESPVVVHCLSGMGRTGQVLAAWLVWDRDYAPERAVETVVRAGRDPREAVERGPATEAELFSLLESLVDR